MAANEGKDLAIVGRYSFRSDGVWVGEQSCGAPSGDVPPQLWLVEDSQKAPKPPDNYALDGAALRKKLADIERRTALGKFRFGTADYDRWAVVFGRVEARKPEDKKAAGNLVFRGSGVILFLTPDS